MRDMTLFIIIFIMTVIIYHYCYNLLLLFIVFISLFMIKLFFQFYFFTCKYFPAERRKNLPFSIIFFEQYHPSILLPSDPLSLTQLRGSERGSGMVSGIVSKIDSGSCIDKVCSKLKLIEGIE